MVVGAQVAARHQLQAERAQVDPKIFTKINFHFVVTGRNLKPAAVEGRVLGLGVKGVGVDDDRNREGQVAC